MGKLEQISNILTDERLSEEQRETLRRFDEEKRAGKGNRPTTRLSYLYVLRELALKFPKPYKEITKNDIIVFINDLKVSDSTVELYKICLKRFFRWLYDLPKHQYPKQVDWIEIKARKTKVTKDKLLTEEELKKLIHAGQSARDKAFVATLWESAFRLGEHLSLKVGSVEPKEYGFDISIQKGKTGTRTIPITITARYLADWLNAHPFRKDRDAPLWVHIRSPFEPLDKFGAWNLVKGCAKRAGIKKRVYPHLLRHTRLTNLVESDVREAQLRNVAGWQPGSPMVGVYVHLSGLDTKKAILKANGVLKEEKPEPFLQPMFCQRCGLENEPTAIYCSRCGTPLTAKSLLAIKNERDEELERLKEQVNNLRRLVEKSAGIKVEHLREAYEKTVLEEVNER